MSTNSSASLTQTPFAPPSLDVSIVIPVYNEQGNLPLLFQRLYPVLDALGRSYEVVFTNDGSVDASIELLTEQFNARPDVTRVIDFNGNYGQHMAIMAAFERVRGNVVVTLDADLQNPPEEIPKLLEKTDAGYDCVGGVRQNRQDSFFRRYASMFVNFVRRSSTSIEMTDQGCMLRAYSRAVVEGIVRSGAINTFLPALAYTLAKNPTEVPVAHEERHAGVSNYSLGKLIRLNFDLITAFTTVPLQLFTMLAMACSAGSLLLVCVLAFRRIFLGAEAEGLFTLFGILFFLISVCMVGIGIIGEYVGRTYQVVRGRTRYQVNRVLENDPTHEGGNSKFQ
ncbi:undecaprenyl-phosphate 4-deoxy-4-formamido-L-arabinose transferase [Ereboglobus sp. PH5-10]|uniref:glycosyltransferase n=1 Tax=Ereboglobus sp. PH5-10 TaxID=2940629 RepID=UPI002406DA08|nr:glycosyltransferase [Ereboglobus sp. PH5-10]MDF9827441.1 undecaprenyl-phosphate 4-deoxy-4-formamido-L-arabinose transferase [Ereboglobus sp. PH5-10]